LSCFYHVITILIDGLSFRSDSKKMSRSWEGKGGLMNTCFRSRKGLKKPEAAQCRVCPRNRAAHGLELMSWE
jgi:hypothetical protein